jgi:hypothetical protein
LAGREGEAVVALHRTTFLVVVPALVVEALNRNGIVTSVSACLGLSVALAIAASFAGSDLWERRRRKTDALFSELTIGLMVTTSRSYASVLSR